jgi:adenylate cyclase
LEDEVMGPVTGSQKESLERARRAIAAALHLIEDLGELARAERVEIERRPVNLCKLVHDLTDEHLAQAAAKEIELSAMCSDDVGTVDTDAVRVRQILGNFLSNAIKYTPAGSITIRTTMHEEERQGRAGLWAVVDVTDNGPGIAADQQRLLFREFQRLSTSEGTIGAGIGLAISRRLARALDGDVAVDSEVGRGSTFGLWLPVEESIPPATKP